MKKIISIIIIFVVWCAIWTSPLLFDSGGIYLPKQDFGYQIEDYDVNIVVDQDKTLHITEKITANFSSWSHGITRYLPLKQTVSFYNQNNKLVSKNYKNSVYNFDFNKSLSSENTRLVSSEESDGYIFYRMGQNSYIKGMQTYCFSYCLNIGDDRISEKDLFYFNIIGTGWDTTIKNVDFSVTFPTEILKEDFSLYVGQYGQDNVSGDDRLIFSTNGKILSGNVKNLDYGEAITVYKKFEEGYFKNQRTYVWDILLLVFAIMLLCGIVVCFVKKRRKNLIVEVVEFKAPEGLTPADVGYINDGKLSGDEISALIVFWASKGYVKLKQVGDEKIKITKIKDLPQGAKQHEKLFFEGLFLHNNEVMSDNLNFSDPALGYKIEASVEKDSRHLFDKTANTIFSVLSLFVVVIFGLTLLKNFLQAHYWGWNLVAGVLFVLLIAIGLFVYPSNIKMKAKRTRKKHFWLFLLNLLSILGGSVGFMFFIEPYSDVFGARFYLIVLLLACVLLYPRIEIYTEAGRKCMGKILGLKKYIMVAEKDRIEMLAEENPELFFEILPFAYVLGVSDEFMKKFDNVEIAQPVWYECDTFTFLYFSNRMFANMRFMGIVLRNNMINHSVSKVVSTVSKISGGGRSSGGGGGFSGGGSGGGGGGRW